MSQNLYIYCYNNPLGFKDPSGFSPDCSALGSASFGKDYLNSFSATDYQGPTADGYPVGQGEPELTPEQKKFWDQCEKEGIKFESKQQFVRLWWQAKAVQKQMLKFEGIANNDELDFSIAFWTCYWNDNASLGLQIGGLVEMAKFIQGIAYVESTYGTNTSDKAKREGVMGVEADTLKDILKTGYLPKSFESKIEYSYTDENGVDHYKYKKGQGLWQDGKNYNASLYAGIGYFLKCVGTNTPGVGTQNLTDLRRLMSGKLNPMGGNLNTYAAAMATYGGCNGFVQNYFGGKAPDNWASVNPYGNGVKSIVENGTIKKSKDGKPTRVTRLP